jgi:hypothetical protein
MTIAQIIKQKLDRLDSVPDDFINSLSGAEKEFFFALVKLLSQLDVKDGLILQTDKNFRILADVSAKMKDVLLDTDYTKSVDKFIKQFDTQAILNNTYFGKAFQDSVIPDVAKKILDIKKETTVNLLLGDNLDSEFINAVKSQVEIAITSKASLSETIDALQTLVTGNSEVDGKLSQYTKQIAYDAFAISDRAYTKAVSDSLGAEFFKYSGGTIKTSRAFCIERHNKFYHKKEIEAWGSGQKTDGLALPDSDGNWAGEIPGTNAQTIFSSAGGYNCRHSILPVSIFVVPKADLERIISEGFYKPSEFEKKELQLN